MFLVNYLNKFKLNINYIFLYIIIKMNVIPVFKRQEIQGIINPLDKRIIKKSLLIDTKFRKNLNDKSTDITINLQENIKNVVSMTLSSLEFPNTAYTINDEHKTNELTIDVSGVVTRFVLDDGNYSATDIVSLFNNTYLPAAGFQNSILTYFDNTTGKFIFYSPITNNPPIVKLDFRIQSDPERNKLYNLGWMLGFRENFYDTYQDVRIFNSGTNSYINVKGFQAEGMYDTSGFKYITIMVKDFKNNVNQSFISAFSNSIPGCPKGCSRTDILAKIAIPHAKQIIGFEDLSDGTYKKREYFGPQNIEKLEIKFLDDYERIINLNSMDYSMTLEFECLYDI